MLKLLTTLTQAVEGAPLLAAASFVWGILSIVLSPCHLASIPLIIGYLQKQPGLSTGKAFRLTSVFAIGILASIAIIGGATAAAGRILGDVGKIGNANAATTNITVIDDYDITANFEVIPI